MYREWTQTDYQNKHYNINQKDEGTQDDRGRDGGTNFILRIKEQETHLTIQEHDNDEIFSHSVLLPNDRSIVSSRVSSTGSAIQCFVVQFTVISLFLKVIQQLLTSSSSSSLTFYPSLYFSFNNLFQKAIPTQYVTNPVSLPSFLLLSVGYSSLP